MEWQKRAEHHTHEALNGLSSKQIKLSFSFVLLVWLGLERQDEAISLTSV
jgi:hypothetical protein